MAAVAHFALIAALSDSMEAHDARMDLRYYRITARYSVIAASATAFSELWCHSFYSVPESYSSRPFALASSRISAGYPAASLVRPISFRVLRNGRYAISKCSINYLYSAKNDVPADLAARKKAEIGGKQAERWSLLAHIRRNLTEAWSKELTKGHEAKIKVREVSRRGYYIPWTKGSIKPTLANAPKNMHRGNTS